MWLVAPWVGLVLGGLVLVLVGVGMEARARPRRGGRFGVGLYNLLRRSARTEGVWETDAGFADLNRPTYAGKRIGQRESLHWPVVTYCISLIADGVATLPTGTFLGTGLERKAVPMPSWLRTPNPYMTP
ncbi:hypothetical protein ACU686_20610 [Yinghuangia aomiensis]